MNIIYILQNQHGYYLKKNSLDRQKEKEWVDGQDSTMLFRTVHKDEAINMLFETNSQHVDLRIQVKEYPVNAKNLPIIPKEDLPPPLPKSTPTILLDDGQNETAFTEPREEHHEEPQTSHG
jgi:hypothetical protein